MRSRPCIASPSTRRGRLPLRQVSFVLLLLLVVVSLIGPAASASQSATPSPAATCAPGTVPDPVTGECVPDPATAPTDPGTDPADASTPADLPSASGPESDQASPSAPDTMSLLDRSNGTVLVTVHECVAGTDISVADMTDLASTCLLFGAYQVFGISDGTAEITTRATTPFDATVSFEDLPLTAYAVYLKNAGAGDTSRVFCDGYTDLEGGPSTYSDLYQSDEHQVFYDFSEAENVACEWYISRALDVPSASPSPSVPTADAEISVFDCPAGEIDSTATHYELAAACTPTLGDAAFTVRENGTTVDIETSVTGTAVMPGLPVGPLTFENTGFDGTPTDTVFCRSYLPDDPATPAEEQVFVAGHTMLRDLAAGETLVCDWYRTYPATQPEPSPDTNASAEMIITKRGCPAGEDLVSASYYDLAYACQELLDGIAFGVSDGTTEIEGAISGDAFPGGADIDKIPPGPASVYEKNAPEGAESVVFCASFDEDTNGPGTFAEVPAIDNQILWVFEPGSVVYCDWFNVFPVDTTETPSLSPAPSGHGDITVYKWECPAGYDPLVPGANPASQCAQPMDGVTFTLGRPDGSTLQSDTGDSVPGAVTFGGQEAGDYTITETLPDGIASAFVWDCAGLSDRAVHPTPLVTGPVLSLDLAAGDAVTCHWYNVPAPTEPETGSLTVYKYLCSTEEYVSEADCELYEWHATFDLVSQSDVVDTATTDTTGMIAWDGLPAGAYTLVEHDGEPCRVVSSEVDEDGNVLVTAGEETVVTVYNCTAAGETPTPGRSPVGFPNTGAPVSAAAPSSPTASPAGEAGPSATADRGICPPVSQPDDEDPTVHASAPANRPGDDSCDRGQVPVGLAIEEIDVDAEVEMLEVVAGEMQAPTTSDVTSWYRETARLGEEGNVVIAGHLNYWGDPEGVFHDLADLEPGDVITVTGADGGIYAYTVTEVEQVAVDSDVSEQVAPTDGETLTLITCGGEWDPAASEYDHRTIVHAERAA